MKQLLWPCQKRSNRAWFAAVHGSVFASGKMYFSCAVFTIGKMRVAHDNLNTSVLGVKRRKRLAAFNFYSLGPSATPLPSPISAAAAASCSEVLACLRACFSISNSGISHWTESGQVHTERLEACCQTDVGRDSGIFLFPTVLLFCNRLRERSSGRKIVSNVRTQFLPEGTSRVARFPQKQKKTAQPLKNNNTLSPSTHMSTSFRPERELRGKKQNRTPWKIQLSFLLNSLCMWFFFFPLRCSPKVASLPAVFFRGCVLITFPSRCLCFIALKPSLRLPPPAPGLPHRHHSGELSRPARQSGERFC